jgi:hypothetical protein
LKALHPGDAPPITAIKLKADPQEKFAKLLQNLLKLGKVVSKPHLASDSCVADLFKMLTYLNVCCAFSSACALLSNAI